MNLVINNLIPFKGFFAINIFGKIFVRKDSYEKHFEDDNFINTKINHEKIHTAQMQDFCKFIPVGGTIFYICYFFEWIYRLIQNKLNFDKSYRSISFEKEAYNNEKNYYYLFGGRIKFSQWK